MDHETQGGVLKLSPDIIYVCYQYIVLIFDIVTLEICCLNYLVIYPRRIELFCNVFFIFIV